MIVYWVLFGLLVFSSLFVCFTSVLSKKKQLLKVGISLLLASIILIFYFSLHPAINSLIIVIIGLTLIGAGFGFSLSISEIRKLVKRDFQLKAENGDLTNEMNTLAFESENPCIVLKSKALILIKDICYIKSDGAYVEYHLINRSIPEVDRNSLKKVMQLLVENHFTQVCRSILVNKNYVVKIEENIVYLRNGVELPFSTNYE